MEENPEVPAARRPEPDAQFFAELRKMRENEPVFYDPMTGQWDVFRYADAQHVMSSNHIFQNDLTELTPPQEDYDLFFIGNIAAKDQPRHRQLRQLVSKAFSARYMAGLEPHVTEIATGLLDELQGREVFDLAEDFASVFPVLMIADILGTPREDSKLFAQWAHALHTGVPSMKGMLDNAKHYRGLNSYMFDLIKKRRAAPKDDLISLLLEARVEGERLQDVDIIGFVGILLLGGISTSSALVTNIALLFDRAPDAWREVRADRSLVPAAIEEIVRLRPSFTNARRMTSCETELGGHVIPEGEVVRVWIPSANRDDAHFENPDRFDIHRTGNRHIGFGHGIHYCIGAPLARLEGSTAFNLLLDRYAELEVVHGDGVTLLDTGSMLGAERLPVSVTRA
ncbi:cytochrome P450 [Streptomyces sp. NPDC059752]|uniref:cytochrome P450 n=1 Tax=unclassified Streptomyces TaxID=2593676 RepID=UPI00364BB3A2